MPSRRAAFASLIALIGCAHPPPSSSTPLPPTSPGYRYLVTATPGAAQLSVTIDLPSSTRTPSTWVADPTLRPYLHDVLAGPAAALLPVPSSTEGWLVPACTAPSGCQVRYRVSLGDAARALDDVNTAMTRSGALLAPPSAWLLRPKGVSAPFVLGVDVAPGESFVSGLALSAPGAVTFRGDVGALDDTPYAAFGRFTATRRRVDGGELDVAFLGGVPSAAIRGWVDGAVGALRAYYRGFPIEHAALVVRVVPGSGVDDGHTMGNGGGAVLIAVGEGTGKEALADDWMLVHELVHVSFPDVGRPWAEEGLATYLEPLIRVRSGLCDADELWRSLVEGLPKGQPEDGDGGLDVTDTWGRRYWGGAMFWFLADVEIRKRTGSARSLDDALRAVNRAGGNVARRWDLGRVLALADEGAGVAVLVPLREKMGRAALRVDLEALWKDLGVSLQGGRVAYDDGAPLASIRRGILKDGAHSP